jgi:tetratricopeptide (TPR) repeat protein
MRFMDSPGEKKVNGLRHAGRKVNRRGGAGAGRRHYRMRNTLVVFAAVALAGPAGSRPAAAQSTQYRSPAGVAYVSQADTGAVARAESALAAEPRNVERIIALGLAQSGIRRYREAIETFTRGIAIAPDNAVLYRWRGHRYLSVRELDRARADLEHGLAIDSTCYGCLYHLGIVRYVTGDFAGAAQAFRRALPLAPEPGEYAGSNDWLWMSLSRAGRPADAQAVLDDITAPIRSRPATPTPSASRSTAAASAPSRRSPRPTPPTSRWPP